MHKIPQQLSISLHARMCCLDSDCLLGFGLFDKLHWNHANRRLGITQIMSRGVDARPRHWHAPQKSNFNGQTRVTANLLTDCVKQLIGAKIRKKPCSMLLLPPIGTCWGHRVIWHAVAVRTSSKHVLFNQKECVRPLVDKSKDSCVTCVLLQAFMQSLPSH